MLVSGASGIVGYGVLRALRAVRPCLRLVGTTIYADTAAEAFSDVFVRAPRTCEAGYLDWLLATVRRFHVDLVIPAIEADLDAWVDWVPEIRAAGASALVNRPGLVRMCQDKWVFHEDLCAAGLDCVIDSSLSDDFEELEARFGLPFVLKPRRGFGSKGIVYINSAATFEEHKHALGATLMAQPLVGGDDAEYTIAVFGDGNGGFSAWLSMRRTLSDAGFTQTAEVVDSTPFLPTLEALCRRYRPDGPTNFQFRVCADGMKLLEINPRISSSTSIRTAFGYNEAAMALAYALDGTLPTQPILRRGRAIRYIEDWVAYDDDGGVPKYHSDENLIATE